MNVEIDVILVVSCIEFIIVSVNILCIYVLFILIKIKYLLDIFYCVFTTKLQYILRF